MAERPTALLSFDFEDWHQLVLRRLGVSGWDAPHAEFERQIHGILDFLDEIDGSATFFLLGITAKNYPRLVREVVARGHEPASHGYAHEWAFRQSPGEFRRDLERSIDVIGSLIGRAPAGYRAPAFSINRDAIWAYGILSELGFLWDSSQYDSPRVPRRLRHIPRRPYLLVSPEGAQLYEIPVAVWSFAHISLPVGGGTYWRVLPRGVVVGTLDRHRPAPPALYFHPCELDPLPLGASLPRGARARCRVRMAGRRLRADLGRRHLQASLRHVAERVCLTSYEHELGALQNGHGSRPRTLSEDGVLA